MVSADSCSPVRGADSMLGVLAGAGAGSGLGVGSGVGSGASGAGTGSGFGFGAGLEGAVVVTGSGVVGTSNSGCRGGWAEELAGVLARVASEGALARRKTTRWLTSRSSCKGEIGRAHV